jgi:hypothetical protein
VLLKIGNAVEVGSNDSERIAWRYEKAVPSQNHVAILNQRHRLATSLHLTYPITIERGTQIVFTARHSIDQVMRISEIRIGMAATKIRFRHRIEEIGSVGTQTITKDRRRIRTRGAVHAIEQQSEAFASTKFTVDQLAHLEVEKLCSYSY